MDQIRRILTNAWKQLGNLGTTQKLLIGSILILMVMTLFLVTQYAGTPSLVAPVPTLAPADLDRATQKLRSVGITATQEKGQLLVPAADEVAARAVLLEDGVVSAGDKAILFENILLKQSWTNSRQQNDQLFRVALQNELSRCISLMQNIKRAQVLIDVPDAAGFGPRMKTPRAAVTVVTRDGTAMGQGTVNAVAGVVAGSVAGLDLSNIRVIDASSGRQLRPTLDDEQLPTTYLEHAAKVESATRDKIENLLSYIPGVVVAVTARVDVTRSEREVLEYSPEKQGTVSLELERSKTTTQSSESSSGATPGPTANQTADITVGAGSGTSNLSEESKLLNEVKVGQKVEKVFDPKGYPTLVAVSVNVPRGYVASLVKPAAGTTGANAPAAPPAGPATGPTDAEVDQKFTQTIKPMIMDSLVPQIRALMVQSGQNVTAATIRAVAEEMLSVSMIPGDIPLTAASGAAGVFGGSGGGGGVFAMGNGIADKVVLGVLGVAAMGMMVAMVRKAGRRAEMPTAEELVGLPPALESTSDLVGEVEAANEALAGIEVDDSQLQSQQMLEQIGALIKENPNSAARLLNRWIEVEE
jgi:flagellar M-ring protein FliF